MGRRRRRDVHDVDTRAGRELLDAREDLVDRELGGHRLGDLGVHVAACDDAKSGGSVRRQMGVPSDAAQPDDADPELAAHDGHDLDRLPIPPQRRRRRVASTA